MFNKKMIAVSAAVLFGSLSIKVEAGSHPSVEQMLEKLNKVDAHNKKIVANAKSLIAEKKLQRESQLAALTAIKAAGGEVDDTALNDAEAAFNEAKRCIDRYGDPVLAAAERARNQKIGAGSEEGMYWYLHNVIENELSKANNYLVSRYNCLGSNLNESDKFMASYKEQLISYKAQLKSARKSK